MFANSASLILRLSHARPCDAPSARCNKHELFGRIAMARSQLASCVNDVRRRAESETYRALLASDDDRLTRFIGSYRTRLVSCACSRPVVVGLVDVVVSFGRGRAGLCKRQWRNQPADQSNDCSFHSDSSFLIRFTSTVRGSRLKRTLFVRLSLHSLGTVSDSRDLRFQRFEWALRIR